MTVTLDGEETTLSARWLIGATGRASLLRRKFGLERETPHDINSAWFRLAEGMDIEDWSDDAEWLGRMKEPRLRWLSTNHLMDAGYWVWLIPLSSGSISIGIVADPSLHPYERFENLDGAFEWLREHEPQLAGAARGPPRPDRGLPQGAALLTRHEADLLARALVPDRRRGRLPRSALLARLGLHRHLQLVHHRSRHDRPRRRADRRARRVLERLLPALLRDLALALPGSLSAVRQPVRDLDLLQLVPGRVLPDPGAALLRGEAGRTRTSCGR